VILISITILLLTKYRPLNAIRFFYTAIVKRVLL